MDPGYRFDFVNRDGSVDTFEIGLAKDDGDAALRARSAMLVSLTAVAVEVWKDGSRLCSIRRDSATHRVPPHPTPSYQALASPRLEAPPPIFSPRADDGPPPSAKAALA
jgi:hypothetical protein